jgi:hypothetical protein
VHQEKYFNISSRSRRRRRRRRRSTKKKRKKRALVVWRAVWSFKGPVALFFAHQNIAAALWTRK